MWTCVHIVGSTERIYVHIVTTVRTYCAGSYAVPQSRLYLALDSMDVITTVYQRPYIIETMHSYTLPM